MKLVIQIPCFNEASTLPVTLEGLPRAVEGVDAIEVLVIDDGSTDGTAEVARGYGVDKVVHLPENRGLANAFAKGLEESLRLGADIIVNTDADNQYQGAYVENLIAPILRGDAEIVIGDRQIDTIEHFSRMKKWLQKLGSRVVRWVSGTDIPDTTSGFRAFSRDAALRLSIYSEYTYTLETIIQAGKKGIAICSVPVKTNPATRESRLIQSTLQYIFRSTITILRIFLMYEALRVFLSISVFPLIAGLFLLLRFGYFFAMGDGSGHIQSLIVASILMVLAFLIILLGLLADLIARNRLIGEDLNYRMKRFESRARTSQ